MIVDMLLFIVYNVVLAITKALSVFNDVQPIQTIVDAVSWANSFLSPVSNILPTGTILAIFSISVTFELGYLTYKGINWLIRKIPAIS